MVGTHLPDDRDEFLSALQRMRAAFTGLRDGTLAAGPATDEFLDGYDVVDAMAATWLLRGTD